MGPSVTEATCQGWSQRCVVADVSGEGRAAARHRRRQVVLHHNGEGGRRLRHSGTRGLRLVPALPFAWGIGGTSMRLPGCRWAKIVGGSLHPMVPASFACPGHAEEKYPGRSRASIGYISDYHVERLWRDSKLLEIGGGARALPGPHLRYYVA